MTHGMLSHRAADDNHNHRSILERRYPRRNHHQGRTVPMNPRKKHSDQPSLLEDCRARSVELLKRNMSPGGMLAATPSARADKRGYTAIFGRDAAICAIGMAL